MANVVEIVIRVDNAQGVQAVRQTISSFDQLGPAIAANTAALQALTAQLNQSGAAATRTGNSVRTMGGHMTTSLDQVRLLSQEFGIRLPRAMESALSRMPGVVSGLAAISGGLLLIGGLEVFAHLGEEAYNLEQKYFSLTAAAKEYNAEVLKHDQEAFAHPQGLDETISRLRGATAEAQRLNEEAQKLSGNFGDSLISFFTGHMLDSDSPGSLTGMIRARGMMNNSIINQRGADALGSQIPGQTHEANVARINAAHAQDAELQGYAKINAELQKKLELEREDARFRAAQNTQQIQRQLIFGGMDAWNSLDLHGADSQQATNSSIAQKEAAAERMEQARKERDETIELRNQATNAGLEGEARFDAQREQAIAKLQQRYRESEISKQTLAAQTAAIEERFDNEREARLEKQIEDAQRGLREARSSGLTGLDRINADHDNAIQNINTDRTLDPQAAAIKRQAADIEATNKRIALEEEFTTRVKQENDTRAQSGLQSFARVAAEEQRLIDEANAHFKSTFGASPSAVASDAHSQEIAGIRSGANQQRVELQEQLNQRVLQMDQEAAAAERKIRSGGLAGWSSDYKATIADIEAQRTAMLAKINAEEGDPSKLPIGAQQQYERMRVDANAKANAEIEAANQQLAKSLASSLEGMFDNPLKFIQQKAKQMMFEVLANWIEQSHTFQGVFGNILGTVHPGGGGAGAGIGGGGTATGALPTSAGSTTSGGAPISSGLTGMMSAAGFGSSSSSSGAAGVAGALPGLISTGTNAADALSQIGQQSSSTVDLSHEAGHSGGLDDSGGFAGTSSLIGTGLAAGIGAYTGTQGLISSFESGKASGIFSGAASGAELGGSVGMLAGPLGAAIGAGIGAAAGAATGLVGWATGEGNNLEAEKYFKNTIRPQMQQAETDYVHGSGNALSAISQVDSAAGNGLAYIGSHFGLTAANWANAAYIEKLRNSLEEQINNMAKGGRDYMSASAAEFHSGGLIDGFGDLALNDSEGFIKALLGETVMNPSASSTHAPFLSAMNSGASHADMASMYLATTRGSGPGSGGTTNHYYDGHTINAMDGADFEDYLVNRGGNEALARANNARATQYAGDGIGS